MKHELQVTGSKLGPGVSLDEERADGDADENKNLEEPESKRAQHIDKLRTRMEQNTDRLNQLTSIDPDRCCPFYTYAF